MLLVNCRRLTELATEYHEGTLTLWQRCNYHLHVLMCPPCANFRDQLALTAAAARAADQAARSADSCDGGDAELPADMVAALRLRRGED